MRIMDVKQGSAAWAQLRLGIPTASKFERIVTPKTMEYSQAAHGYIRELLCEIWLGKPVKVRTTGWMARGIEQEVQARKWYAFEREVEPLQVGFCLTDDGTAGCSPDALINEDGGMEIKCPSAAVHMANLMGEDPATTPQVQGALWVTERDWWDVLSWNGSDPARRYPPVLVRYPRNEAFIKAIEEGVARFTVDLAKGKERLTELAGAGGRLSTDTESLEEVLKLSLVQGVEPDPDVMSDYEVMALSGDVDLAVRHELIDGKEGKRLKQLAIDGEWTAAREEWAKLVSGPDLRLDP